MLEGLSLDGMVVTADALHGRRETARAIARDMGAHYVLFIKANQPSLLDAIITRLTGTNAEFASVTWTDQGKGHGRREKRTIRTAPASGIDWPHAEQVFRIRRDTGPTAGPWVAKEIAYGITSLPASLAGPRHLAIYARRQWAIENKEHYATPPSGRTRKEPAPGTSQTPTQPSATS